MSTSTDFTGRVILITGSSSGIGAGIATYLSGLGASVVITGRNVEKIKSVANECREISKQKVLEVVADVQKDEDIKRLIDETINEFGKLDVLVNNAGIFAVGSIADPNLMGVYDKVMNTNTRGVVLLTSLAIPHLEKTKGNIINISSVAGVRPSGSFLAYAMAKCALDMLTRCLALDLGPKGIRVNSINPAAIRTEIFDKLGIDDFNTDQLAKLCAKSYPLRRIGEVIDCAKAVAYLSSNDASFVSGACLPVDGASLNANLLEPE